MVQCDNCDKKLGFFSTKHTYEDDKGNTVYYCTECHHESERKENEKREKREREQKKKDIKIIHENVSKCVELIQEIFENEAERDYAKKIISFFLKKREGEYDYDYPFIEHDNVGYKAKVIKKLRELDILKKWSSKEFILNIYVSPEDDSEDEEEYDEDSEDEDDSTEETFDEESEEGEWSSFSANPVAYSTAALKKIEAGLSLHRKIKKK